METTAAAEPRFVEITGCDLPTLVRAAYDLSRPQGLGFLHARPGPLDDETVKEVISYGNDNIALNLDYVRGRACKLVVWRKGERLFTRLHWFDHSSYDLDDLLKAIGKSDAPRLAELPT